ncbi:hypothetical protein BU15DRAFT_76089 [Melanogaster broomeanus]|nr:hypothetical protein BU15DRAFT_76089 [Melanogaster broomeanus]
MSTLREDELPFNSGKGWLSHVEMCFLDPEVEQTAGNDGYTRSRLACRPRVSTSRGMRAVVILAAIPPGGWTRLKFDDIRLGITGHAIPVQEFSLLFFYRWPKFFFNVRYPSVSPSSPKSAVIPPAAVNTSAHRAIGTHGLASCLGNVAFQAVSVGRPSEPRFRVFISGLSLYHPPKIGWTHFDDHFYVRISLDGRIKETSPTSMRRMPMENIVLDGAHDSAIVTLEVLARRNFHEDAHLGKIQGYLSSFMGSNVLYLPLGCHHDQCGNTQISFSIENITSPHPDSTQNPKTQRTQKETTRHYISEVASDPMVCKLLAEAESCAPLLEKIHLFSLIAEGFAEIHPYAKFVWNIMSMVVKMTAGRKLLSHNIKKLFDAMDDAYNFVSEANQLEWIESHRKIIKDLSQHTADCAQFIKEIAGQNGFGKTILAATTEAKIHDYITRFKDLQTALSQRASLALLVHLQGSSEQIAEFSVRRADSVCTAAEFKVCRTDGVCTVKRE